MTKVISDGLQSVVLKHQKKMVIVNAYTQGKTGGFGEGAFIASPRKTVAMEYQPILEGKRGSIMQMMTATAY